ncbi:pollen Ole e 1 allergen and extensin family protein [Actinidia rufa]|uniref:Pollen Ole e 1 allergen and extensin family protein n=1 Tax=Actinidia rufa TaxID=165716 RepID=A0A7J0GW93_9ERIC|nr:pollen Ole e 1 allergen and extensin family protein [Actinidia rufa]
MATTHIMAIVSLLLLSLTFHSIAAYDEQQPPAKEAVIVKHVDVVVEGMVYCQSCDRYGTWSLTRAEPIAAAKVSVICKDHRNRVSYYKAFETDAHGYFYAQLRGFTMGNYLLDHPLTSCRVKLISSPLESCNLLTNVNYGINGSPLRYEDKRLVGTNYEAVIYAAGPLAFRPAKCVPATYP